jgi:D-alanyl-D-alanine carboxypeptidase
VVLVSVLFTLSILGYKYYEYYQLTKHQSATITTLTTDLAASTETIKITTQTIATLEKDLALARATLSETEAILRDEQNRNEEFANQIERITETIEILDKLANTDAELLKKYSKIFFLNEHYTPPRLREIDDKWKYSEDRSHQLHSQVMPFFERMMEAAKDDGIDLWVVSAFRSFDTQAQLKAEYTVRYGTGANAFSADQGYSEHQLGTAVDFTTAGMNGGLSASFENTEAYQWLTDNAHKYGFTLSYPRGNAYYIFEPWHWRFVGRALARDLKRDNAHFYDWEQRRIDEYLVKIFD